MVIRKIPSPFKLPIYNLAGLYAAELFAPFESRGGSTLGTKILLLGIFAALAIIGSRLLPTSLKRKNLRPADQKTLWLLRLCSLVGPIALMVDRFVYRGLDVSRGLTSMRYTMLRESDGSVSSIFSVLGYTVSGLSFVLLVNLIIFTRYQSKKLNILDLILVLYTILGVSALTGGRTTIYIFVGIIYGAFFCKINLLKQRISLTGKNLLISLLISGTLLAYCNYIFHDRARLTGVEASTYYSNIISHLGGEEKENVSIEDSSEFYIYSQITLAYLVHQFWVLDKSLELPESLKVGDPTFVGWKVILSKTGIFKAPKPWNYSGFYVPLVGNFIFKLGAFFGIVTFFLFILIIFSSACFYLKRSRSLLAFFIFSTVSYIQIAGIYLPSTDVLMMPMMSIGVAFFYPIISWISKPKGLFR